MPYRWAHWPVIFLLVVAGFAFWRDYLAVLAKAPWAWHLHGVTATLWIVTLALQSWSAATRRFALHRIAGRASLALFPLFLAGSIAVIHTMAAATPTDRFYQLNGVGLGVFDTAGAITFAWLYYRALKERRNVQRHARFMLATPLLLLLSPALGRIFTHFVPGFYIAGPQDFADFVYAYHLSDLIAAGIAFALYRQAPRHGLPFLVVALVTIGQSVGFQLAPHVAPWRDAFLAFGRLPAVPVVLTGLIAGATIAWAGWIAGQRPTRAAAPATA